ncbi:hypothetical protein HanRHA438_Chr10g0462221 [Helianthus annuus]|nr:splicing factor U2af large subunit A isoform X2 [Helianthus annuus]KAJ0514456.1 hypothetical protein HanHA300_Chr10g0369711 [Helianthus annuus]KAJ0530600.1 hypothetical protein HanHA89_Chr10g0391651 [Helianthus annuus]KAJ0697454.1 hypothetical protein HanLR1_Chr10g0369081 [Helianthus annuus]KAJ0880359.1 hypothetical protein HanRHA438_Chr10g0462221 [Helianthus annuus]
MTEIERIGVVDVSLVLALILVQEPNLNVDHGLVLVHTPKGQVPGAAPAIPGMFQNMFSSASGQFGGLHVMPVQVMTQQATRHARRVYVCGLSPRANEQAMKCCLSKAKGTGEKNFPWKT